jgi:hypothetical protein
VTEPTTAAGRALLDDLPMTVGIDFRRPEEDICAIEAEAVAADRASLIAAVVRRLSEPTTNFRTSAARTLFDKAMGSATQEITISAQALRMVLPAIEEQAIDLALRAALDEVTP